MESDFRGDAPSGALILVVEDDLDIRAMLVELLLERGYQTHEATNGSQALAWLRETPRRPDLILLDLRMPVMDGARFRQEQQGDAAFSSIPVLLVSAELQGAEEAEELGVSAFLAKPFDVDELFSTIAWVLMPGGGDPDGARKPGALGPRADALRGPLPTRSVAALKKPSGSARDRALHQG